MLGLGSLDLGHLERGGPAGGEAVSEKNTTTRGEMTSLSQHPMCILLATTFACTRLNCLSVVGEGCDCSGLGMVEEERTRGEPAVWFTTRPGPDSHVEQPPQQTTIHIDGRDGGRSILLGIV